MADKAITPKELKNLRAEAQRYAYTFLSNKYRDEYTELYAAYLSNRGHKVRLRQPIIDERLIAKENK